MTERDSKTDDGEEHLFTVELSDAL